MKVSRLLEQHRKFQKQGLADNLGDGFLIENNRVFRNIRVAAKELGFQFSSEPDAAYETFPLLQLDRLLKNKKFPYSNNVAGFDDLSAVQLEALSWQDLDGNLKKNFIFHEACHGVVRDLLKKNLNSLQPISDLRSEREFTLRMLLEESSSNACELFGCLEVADPAHRIFYEMNSYVCEFENRTNLKNAVEELSAGVLIRFMLLSYLSANFLRPGISDREFQEMLRLSGAKDLNPKQLKTIRALGKLAFNLNERFRIQTTSFHLRLAGIKTSTQELFDFDFLSSLKNEKGLNNFLSDFVEMLAGE